MSLVTGLAGARGLLVQLPAKKVNKPELENVHAQMAPNLTANAKENPFRLNLAMMDLVHPNALGLAGVHGPSVMLTVTNPETPPDQELAGVTMVLIHVKVNPKNQNHATGQSVQLNASGPAGVVGVNALPLAQKMAIQPCTQDPDNVNAPKERKM